MKSFVRFCLLLFFVSGPLMAQNIVPLLEFPESGMDDPQKYQEYKTRFYRDSKSNSVQIYLQESSGRIVHLWADAANESLSFSVRDVAGKPAVLAWGKPGGSLSSSGKVRYLQHTLQISSSSAELGHFLLGTMRKERDFQYFKKHLLPFGSDPFHEPELLKLIENLRLLPEDVRARHLNLLNAKNVEELRSRMDPKISLSKTDSGPVAVIEQVTFDGRNHLQIELHAGSNQTIEILPSKILVRSAQGNSPIRLEVKIGTDSDFLHPLDRKEIFNGGFWKFYDTVKGETSNPTRFKWLDREVRGMELLSSKEKLMAGIPNFATYFGRDTMMSALMMEPIWSTDMLEHAIGSVLRKISDTGEVSHEEALGGQAIRENADEYNKSIEEYFKADSSSKQKGLMDAEKILPNLQAVRENYHMIDDDFQFAVLVARYLQKTDVPASGKRSFLLANAREEPTKVPRLALLLRNLIYVCKLSTPYIEQPKPTNLVGFPKLDDERWRSGSWRDSGVGYANGRFAMDINAIWVPQALKSLGIIMDTLRGLHFTTAELESFVPELGDSPLLKYSQDREKLKQAINTWYGAERHFWVRLTPQQVGQKVKSKLDWLPPNEGEYWRKILAKTDAQEKGLEFLALSLDAEGRPIPVVNTDPATYIFLVNLIEEFADSRKNPGEIRKVISSFTDEYPVALFAKEIGPLVANDVYAFREVWEMFRKDEYHSPRVVWGREVNLFILGLAKQILAAQEGTGKAREPELVESMQDALKKTLAAVESSGLKHNELWSYRIENGKLKPARYGTSSDIQLWNLTDLAVQFVLQRLIVK